MLVDVESEHADLVYNIWKLRWILVAFELMAHGENRHPHFCPNFNNIELVRVCMSLAGEMKGGGTT